MDDTDTRSEFEQLEDERRMESVTDAAPDLLEALKEAVANCPCPYRPRHRPDCLAPEWDAIISKAEGRA